MMHLFASVTGASPGAAQATWACQLLAVLLLTCIVWHAVSCVEIAARRSMRLLSSVLFFSGKFWSSLLDLAQQRRQRLL